MIRRIMRMAMIATRVSVLGWINLMMGTFRVDGLCQAAAKQRRENKRKDEECRKEFIMWTIHNSRIITYPVLFKNKIYWNMVTGIHIFYIFGQLPPKDLIK